MSRCIGFDISLNHGAAVELTNGKRTWFAYYTNVVGVAARHENGSRLPPPPKKGEDPQPYQVQRLAWIENWIDKVVLVPRRPDFAGIEDYALRAEQGAHQLGEVGGIARILFWFRGIQFRKHDPTNVKMFATWDGTAQKDLIERRVADRWGADYSAINAPAQPGKKQSRTSSEDLADAHAVAKLVDTERLVRAGLLTLDKLEHNKERQVFNRTTKTYPISLLGREWIQNPNGSFGSPDAIKIRLEAEIQRARKKNPKLAAYLETIAKG